MRSIFIFTVAAAGCAFWTSAAFAINDGCNTTDGSACLIASNAGTSIAFVANCSTASGQECMSTSNGSSGDGLDAASVSGNGVHGQSSNGGTGVVGVSHSGYGVNGTSTTGTGGYFTGVLGLQAVGTTSDGLYGSSTSGAGVVGDSSSSYGVYGHSGTGWSGYFDGNVDVVGSLTVGSCSGCTSDIRLKKDVKPLAGAIDQLLQLRGVTFEWKAPAEHDNDAATQRGFIAQDVEKVFPNWVHDGGYTAPDGQKYKTLELRQIEALEVESIRTLKTENDALKERVAALESGHRPLMSGFDFNGLGFGVGGIAIAGALIVTRRRRVGPTNLES